MKKPKSYRFQPDTIEALELLKQNFPSWTETEIVEAAIRKAASEKIRSKDEGKSGSIT